MCEIKLCRKCGTEKPLTADYWSRDKYEKNGYHNWCKECDRKYQRGVLDVKPNIKPTEDGYKICTKCGVNKPFTSEFYVTLSKPSLNSSQCKDCMYEHYKNWRTKQKNIVYNHYSGTPPQCACCGEDQIVFLEVDHINGDGNKHRREIGVRGGRGLYKWLIENNFPEGFRILCRNCNWGHRVLGYCPHHPTL